MNRMISDADIQMKLDLQMQIFIEILMKRLMDKEEEFLDSFGTINDDGKGCLSAHKLTSFEDPIHHRQIDFWFGLFLATLGQSVKYPSNPDCDLGAWFNETILPQVTKDFAPSCPEEHAQLFAILGQKCLNKIGFLLPSNMVSRALIFNDDSLRKRVVQGALDRDQKFQTGSMQEDYL